jgi:hypothetical protein
MAPIAMQSSGTTFTSFIRTFLASDSEAKNEDGGLSGA